MVEEEVAVLIALVLRHRRAVGAAVRRAVNDEVPGAIEEEVGPAAVRCVPPGLLDALRFGGDVRFSDLNRHVFYTPESDENGPRFKPGARGRRPVWLRRTGTVGGHFL